MIIELQLQPNIMNKEKYFQWRKIYSMANIYRRANGTYCIRVSNGKKNGKQILIATTYKPPKGVSGKAAEKGAKEFAVLFEAAVHNGMITPGRKQRGEQINPFGITLSEFIEKHYYQKVQVYQTNLYASHAMTKKESANGL